MTLAKVTSLVPGAESIRSSTAALEPNFRTVIFEKGGLVSKCMALGWPGLSAQGRFQKQVCCGCQSNLF